MSQVAPFNNARLLGILGVLGLGLVGGRGATEPTWKEIETAAQARDASRLESWVRSSGTGSATAANVLIAAGITGDRALVDQVLAWGVSPGATNLNGVAPLLHIARNGQTEMVGYFLKRGAEANILTFCDEGGCQGHTPLLWAACRQDLKMTRMLLEAGANPRVAADGAIRKANESGDVELFLLLQKYGARVPESASGAARASGGSSPESSVRALGLTQLLPGYVGHAGPATITNAPGKCRLSVIADDRNVALADLLVARLSGQPLLELVERQELDRILAEQRLSHAFACDAANYGRVGELLRADALLLIQERQLGGTRIVESRLIRVNPGLVLDTVYSASQSADPTAWVEHLSARTIGLTGKVIRHDAIALSLLNIRASVGSTRSRGLDQTLAVLLSDRLAHQPHFVFLERAAMDRVNAESTGSFWTGSYLVDGTVEPSLDGSGNFALTIRFQPTGRGEPLTFSAAGKRSDPAVAVDMLLSQINSRLVGTPVPQARDLVEEARRYKEESRWALQAEQPALAQPAAEAAWALGLRDPEIGRLRVQAPLRMIREQRDPGVSEAVECLDLAVRGLSAWREFVQELPRPTPPEILRSWLEFGVEAAGEASVALLRMQMATEQLKHAERLEALRNLLWDSLQDVWERAAELPPELGLGNAATEKQADLARLLFPQTPNFLRAARTILDRKFAHAETATRARVRCGLLAHWTVARQLVSFSRTTKGTVFVNLPPGDDASRQLSLQLRNSAAPEDRYVSAWLTIWTASLRGETTAADLDRLRASVFELVPVLATGGDVFGIYWERFEALDNLGGVPFFEIHRTYSPNKDRMWERHTAEHAEFRRQLFLRLCAQQKAPGSEFRQLLSPDQYTPEQMAEVMTAQVQASGRGAGAPPLERRAARSRPLAVQPSPPPPPVAPSSTNASTLEVRRLWTPFDLGLELAPEFKADFVSMITVEGRIWLHGCTLDPGGQPDRHYVFAIDPGPMRTKTYSLPAIPSRWLSLNGRMVITSALLAYVSQDGLAICDRATERWETYPEIRAVGLTAPVLVGEVIYLLTSERPGNALIAFNLKNRTSEVLASTRRRPAASPFDDPALEMKSISSTEQGEVLVVAGAVRQTWNPARRTWQPNVPVSGAKGGPGATRSNDYGRVGTIRKVNGVVALHFQRPDAPPGPIPITFARPQRVSLPPSRYGPQNIRPDYCHSFPGGLLLVPSSGSGLWIITQTELDDYLRAQPGSSRPVISAAK